MQLVHMTRHLRIDIGPLNSPTHAPRLWRYLRTAFPDTLAATLMLEHVHLFSVVASEARAAASFDHALRAFSQPIGPGLWLPWDGPERIRGRKHFERMIRYIALNPCRNGLARDPLSWRWSTYRDLIGATVDPWVTPDRVRPLIRARYRDLVRFHEYVSSDPSVDVDGTPFPEGAPRLVVPARSIGDIQRAAASSLRSHPDDVRRRGATRNLFLGLARHQGWNRNRVLADACEITRRSARRIRVEPGSPEVLAAALCLGDPRLLEGTPLPTPKPFPTDRAFRPETGRLALSEGSDWKRRPLFGRI